MEHLKGIILFKELYIIIGKAMKEIQEHSDSDSDDPIPFQKAYSLLSATEICSFVVAMATVSKVFSPSHS